MLSLRTQQCGLVKHPVQLNISSLGVTSLGDLG